jgi:membrane protein implicated in regulation of membrane protease activity
MQIFTFLEGMSPWWWVTFAIILGAAEMATMSFFLIWPALAGLVVGLILALMPALSGNLQIALFALLSVVFTFLGRSFIQRRGAGDGPERLNARAGQMVGRHGETLSASGPEGTVIVDDIRWQARWADGQSGSEGQAIRVTGTDAMVLLVENV